MLARLDQLDTVRCIRRHPRVGREELLAFQSRKLRRVIEHAYRNVAYYRRHFDKAGIKPEDIKSAEDLHLIPITTKAELKKLPLEDLLATWADPRKLVNFSTSGSTGEPFTIHQAPFEKFIRTVCDARRRRDRGIRLRDRLAYVGMPREVKEKRRGRWFVYALPHRLGINRRYPINCRQSAEVVVRALERIDPDLISGYSGAIAHIAPLVAGRRSTIKPRLILTGAETLLPDMRQLIEECFGARVLDTYGTIEMSTLAAECVESGLYHILDDNVAVEILRDGQPVEEGERGEVIATSLHCYAMPFIRYRIGDIVTKGGETCPCGQPFATLRGIQGRMIDYYPLPGGRVIHHYEIGPDIIGKRREWIRQYQIIQESEERMVMRIAVMNSPPEGGIEEMERELADLLGSDVDFRVELVDEIDFEPTGKFRLGRSLIKSNYDGFDWDRVIEPESSQ